MRGASRRQGRRELEGATGSSPVSEGEKAVRHPPGTRKIRPFHGGGQKFGECRARDRIRAKAQEVGGYLLAVDEAEVPVAEQARKPDEADL